ncbi:MAG: class F sortase, partial [Litorilinea sp.]
VLDTSLGGSALPQLETPQLETVRARLLADQIVPLPTQPQRLTIPALDVDAPIEAVGRGQDATGQDNTMALPSHWDTTAWYAPGTRPGQLGNAVIAGHFNTPRDRPAVFWDLAQLIPGDEIHVHDSDGTLHIFVVDRVEEYPFDAAPIAEIFGFTPHARQLNLITCAGEWNRTVGNYTKRLVVETTLQESIPPSPGLMHNPPAAASLRSAEN